MKDIFTFVSMGPKLLPVREGWVGVSRGGVPRGGCTPPSPDPEVHPSQWTEGMTHAYENITFPSTVAGGKKGPAVGVVKETTT